MRMTIRFSAYADGPRNPSTAATVGEAVLGPAGFLGMLEQHWGLQRPESSQAVRIGQYVGCLAREDTKEMFYSRSFKADSWETARTLLEWRDQLVLAGWQGQPLLPGSRLAALAVVEGTARERLSPGFADRLRDMTVAVSERSASADWLGLVQLAEPRQDFEPWWRAMFDALESRGVEILDAPEVVTRASGDLGLSLIHI